MRTSIPEKVLMELWQGHIIPSEDAPIRKDYSEVMKDITAVRTILQSIQPEDARILTDKLLGLLAQSADMESETAFIRGYQLGARLTLAALDEKGDSVKESTRTGLGKRVQKPSPAKGRNFRGQKVKYLKQGKAN